MRKYAQEHPDSPRAPEALYKAVYRQGALNDMYSANGDDKKAGEAKARAVTMAGTIADQVSAIGLCRRAASLIYQLQESIPIYGVDRSNVTVPEGLERLHPVGFAWHR